MYKARIEKLNIEESKKMELLLDHEKAVSTRINAWGTALSIFIPLLIGALTIAYNVHLQTQRAKIDFELKAADIVMSAESPYAAVNKARILVNLFPEHLSPKFHEAFEQMYGQESR